jgi:hypothetical protein
MALSEDLLAISGTAIQLFWAGLLRRVGLFDRWKRKGERIRKVIERRRRELDEFYREDNIAPTV